MSVTHTTVGAGDRASPWSAVVSVSIGAFALVTSEFLPVGLLPQIARDLHITDGEAGLMVTMPGFLAAVAALLTPVITARRDRRSVLLALLGLLAASNAVVAIAGNLPMLLLGRVLLGVAVGGFWTIGGSVGPRLRPGAEGVRATSIIFSGVSLGTVAGVPAGALIGGMIGWRWSFAGGAIMALVALCALAARLPSLPAQPGTGLRQIPALLKHRIALTGLVATALLFVGQFATYTYVTPFLNQVANIHAGTVSAVLLGYGVAGFAGNALGGWAAGRDVRKALSITALIVGGSVVLLALTGAHPAAAVVAVIAWGVGFGMMPIAMQTWLFSATPDRLESMASLFVSIAQLSLGTGALLGGLVVDHLGVAATMWMGGAMAIATAALIFQSEHGRRVVSVACCD